MVLLVIFVNIRLRDSRLGRAWIAVREDEVAAAAMGVNLVRTKLWAYAIGASLGGFAGAFLGTYNNTVNVDQFEFGFSVFILCMVIIGGMGNIWGVMLGAVVLSLMNRYLLRNQRHPGQDRPRLRRDVDQLRHLRLLPARDDGAPPRGLPAIARRKLELHADVDESDHIGAQSDHEYYETRDMTEQRTEQHDEETTRRRRPARRAQISKIFGGLVAVNDVTFRVPPKAIVSLIGPNGAGKTTFFNCLTGLYRPTTGRVLLDGKEITAKRADLVTKAGVARTFQNISCSGTMTSIENVQVGMHERSSALA